MAVLVNKGVDCLGSSFEVEEDDNVLFESMIFLEFDQRDTSLACESDHLEMVEVEWGMLVL